MMRAVLGLVMLSVVFLHTASAAERSKELFDFGWRFHAGAVPGSETVGFDDTNWVEVNLPHDNQIFSSFDEKAAYGEGFGFLPGSDGWYRKQFATPQGGADRKVWLKFEGVYMAADVWINGTHLGRNYNGYLGFEHDITDQLKPTGQMNLVAVSYKHQPYSSRWYTGNGIYRHVWLETTGKVYVPEGGVFITTPKVSTQESEVVIQTELANESGAAQKLSVQTEIYDEAGNKVASVENVIDTGAGKPTAPQVLTQTLTLRNPRLWSPSSPSLYKAKTCVRGVAGVLDDVQTCFGIRSIIFDSDKGLLINGEREFAKGFNIHHDLGCLGAAAFDRAIERRLETMKALGVNAIRLSHNPHAPKLLELCDRMGFLVYDEAYDKWQFGNDENSKDGQYYLPGGAFENEWRKDLARFIRRDRNHPSVIVWSVGNEVASHQNADRAKDDYGVGQLKAMMEEAKKVDPSRPVTCALNPGRKNGKKDTEETASMAHVMDVVSYNYTQRMIEKDHARFPAWKFLVSEAFTGMAQLFTFNSQYVAGFFFWGGVDYLGEARKWPNTTWNTGYVDRAGFIKGAGYGLKAFWSNEPFVKITVRDAASPLWSKNEESWNWNEGEIVEIEVFSNAEAITLSVNGKNVGAGGIGSAAPLKGSNGLWKCKVRFEKGVIEAKAVVQGQAVADRLETAGDPFQVRLIPDRPTIASDGQDLCFVKVVIVDALGRLVPSSSELVKFSVAGEGSLEGLDNGDPASHERFKADTRSLFRGKALAVIRSTQKPGAIKLSAHADGLRSGTLEIATQPIVQGKKESLKPFVESLFGRMRREGKTGLVDGSEAGVVGAPKSAGKPEPFSFEPLARGDLQTTYESNTIEIKGLVNGTASISIPEKNEEAAYCINDGEFTSAPGAGKNGDRVRVRLMTGAGEKTKYFLKLEIGGEQAIFSVTTR